MSNNGSINKKLWAKNIDLEEKIERFTVGKDRELDIYLAPYDVLGSIAHIKMLAARNLLDKEEQLSLHKELISIYKDIENGKFEIEEGVEDVHSQVELLLTQRLGDSGKKIHTGRSRNDQVALDMRLFMRGEIEKISDGVSRLFDLLIRLSEKYKNVLMPGYTHTQVAMPSSFGLWFSAFAESLIDDMMQLLTAYKIVNRNPLGSAAGYGSSFPLDRKMTTELLGFDDLNYNSIYAQMGRGRSERIVSQAVASVAETLGRLASDVILFLSQNFSFIAFPDSLTTGSSIMPHKKNPDVFEILRAKTNRIKSLPNEIALITTNLLTGYHRDLQLIKERFLPALFEMEDCLHVAEFSMAQIRVRDNILDDEKYQYLFSVEAVDDLVMEGMSFRDAYKKVAADIGNGKFERPVNKKYTHEGSIGNLQTENLERSMQELYGQFNFNKIRKAYDGLLKI